jgi:uncharacterized protein YndB with AHSA1/START domain
MSQMTDELAIRKSIVVNCSVERAFRVFTEEIGSWWPFAGGHSIFEQEAETAVVEGRVGGRVYERARNGDEGDWGTVTAWDPPRRFAMTWHPGRGEETAQELEVVFSADGEGTRVELVHTGWERLGARMDEAMAGYQVGWDRVLSAYVAAAGKES